jgi:acyl carrier protein
MTQPLSSEAFRRLLADLLEVDVARVTPEAYFISDLGVDSLHMLHALLRLEQLGLQVRLELAWQIQTVGDAYRLYLEQVAGSGEGRG